MANITFLPDRLFGVAIYEKHIKHAIVITTGSNITGDFDHLHDSRVNPRLYSKTLPKLWRDKPTPDIIE